MGCCSGGNCSCAGKKKNTPISSILTDHSFLNSGYSLNWSEAIKNIQPSNNIVEVRFKNNRKGFYINSNKLRLQKNDRIVVKASPGHDLGVITFIGEEAMKRYDRQKKKKEFSQLMTLYRIANKLDINNWLLAKQKEFPTLIKAREIIRKLELNMKLGDVEYQGDGKKAIFYYTAEDRVDFRELIKVYGKTFNVKIEMKQIGVRQESAHIGGIASCGREFCCSTWRSDLSSVTIEAARVQQLPENAQKLAGQCGKLKCCLMYELDTYLEAQADFPDELLIIESNVGAIYPYKKDILKKQVWYSKSKNNASELIAIKINDIKKAIELNKKGKPFFISAEPDIDNPFSLKQIKQKKSPKLTNKKKRTKR